MHGSKESEDVENGQHCGRRNTGIASMRAERPGRASFRAETRVSTGIGTETNGGVRSCVSVLVSSTNSPLKTRGIFEHESFSTNAHVIACTPFETPSSRMYPPDASRPRAMITWNESIPTRALEMRVASPGVSHARSVKSAFYLRLDSLAQGEIVGARGSNTAVRLRSDACGDACLCPEGRASRALSPHRGNPHVASPAMLSIFDILRFI